MASGAVVRSVDDLALHSFAVYVAMAINAPAHRQVRKLPHALHGLHRAVTVLTLDSGSDVRPVVEAGERGKVVNAHPPDRRRSFGRAGCCLPSRPSAV